MSQIQSITRTQAERTATAESRMISAAIGLLNSVGLSGTTLVAIGLEAGYSRGLATHHFGSKAGLFRAVLRHVTEQWTNDLLAGIEGKQGLAAIIAGIDAHLAHVLAHPDFIRAQYILWGEALDPSSEFKPNVAEFMRIQRESVANWVRDGQAAGDIREEIDAGHYAEQFYGALFAINQQWLFNPEIDLAASYGNFKSNTLNLLSTQT